jgi:hypothetical protein
MFAVKSVWKSACAGLLAAMASAVLAETRNASAETQAEPASSPLLAKREAGFALPITNVDPGVSYLVRVGAAHKLPKTLGEADRNALLNFLDERYGEKWSFLKPIQFNAVKNELVIALASQRADLAEPLADKLMKHFEDKSYDEMWRNYCVQFMGQLYDRMDQERRNRCVKLLGEGVLETKTCVPGAALIALKRISASDPKAVDGKELAAKAYAVLTDKEAIEINMTTSLQTCAQLKNENALPVARRLAGDAATPAPLRISAIAALGQLGDQSDKELLRKLKASTDVRLSTASMAALKRLEDLASR